MARRALIVAVLALTAACGSSTPTASESTTTTTVPTTTTARPSCPAFGSSASVTGAAAVTREPAIALLANVQVQASACVDEVAFAFMGGLPGWSAGYADGPLTEDPSGRSLSLAGDVALLVRFEPASAVDQSQEQLIETYDGPTSMRPPAPSDVAEVRRVGDFEAVTSWAIGLDESRPFEVVTRDDQLVIRVAVAKPRTTRCSAPDLPLTFGYPDDWYAELSDRWVCRFFDPEPFVVHPATNDIRWAVTVQTADVDAAAVLARMESEEMTTETAEVAGLPATRIDLVADGDGLLPAGFTFRMYVVDTGPQALTIVGAASAPGAQVEVNRRAVDAIAASAKAE